jgi:hypothetical protein
MKGNLIENITKEKENLNKVSNVYSYAYDTILAKHKDSIEERYNYKDLFRGIEKELDDRLYVFCNTIVENEANFYGVSFKAFYEMTDNEIIERDAYNIFSVYGSEVIYISEKYRDYLVEQNVIHYTDGQLYI